MDVACFISCPYVILIRAHKTILWHFGGIKRMMPQNLFFCDVKLFQEFHEDFCLYALHTLSE